MLPLEITRCLECNANNLAHNDTENSIVCQSCSASYEMYGEVPCLIRYQPDETLSLVEILAQVGKGLQAPTKASYDTWCRVLAEHHEVEDKEAHIASFPEGGIKTYLAHRYRQYQILKEFLADIDFEGKTVLNIGSGLGFDTAVLQSFGAKIISSEFNPLLCEKARGATPPSEWVAASGHALPFIDNAFDIAICQATLHHMLYIPQCIEEMLRVVKVGGTVITMSDSYRGKRYGEDFVCNHFNNDLAVLTGVNENIPGFAEFSETPAKYTDSLDIKIYTSRVHGYPDPELNQRRDILDATWWDFEAAESLADTNGGISWILHKKNEIAIPAPTHTSEVIAVSTLLSQEDDRAEAMAVLAQNMPEEFVNLPFPGPVGNLKFQLLNGWRKRAEEEEGRSAFNRARWFLEKENPPQNTLHVQVKAHETTLSSALDMLVNGHKVAQLGLEPDWTALDIDVAMITENQTFCLELVLAEQGTKLNEGLFQVREISLR